MNRDVLMAGPDLSSGAVTVVIPVYNQAHFLGDALASCLAQSIQPDAIIVVDDGSSDDPAAVVADFPGVDLVRQANGGLSAARNAGLALAHTPFIAFLDADDRFLPGALEAGLRVLAERPEAVLAYGAYRYIDAAGAPISDVMQTLPEADPRLQFLRRGNFIAMHATVVFRREALAQTGGYDISYRSCEDYELYMRIARTGVIVSHPTLVAEYRSHGANMSRNHRFMLATALRALDAQIDPDSAAETREAAGFGRKFWAGYYAGEAAKDSVLALAASPRSALATLAWSLRTSPMAASKITVRHLLRRSVATLPPVIRDRLRSHYRRWRRGRVDFGDFSRVAPFSTIFGFDRGKPIDRHYIEAFLDRQKHRIAGRVLEIGDNAYTMRFGGSAVTKSDVLHVEAGNPAATIVGDLSEPGVLPDSAFDAIILTQTLHLIFDMPKAVAALARALKPGGVLLITVPGITPVDRGEWGRTWYWSLTEAALNRLLEDAFATGAVVAETHGNVFAAVSFLHGLACEDVPLARLAPADPQFPVIVAACATRPA
jgi:SAM-dependent methyltransferase